MVRVVTDSTADIPAELAEKMDIVVVPCQVFWGDEVYLDGIDLTPLLTGNNTLPERPIFWHYPHYSNQGGKPGAAIRLGNFKLIEFFEDQHTELYDLSADVGEQNDLSATYPEKCEEMTVLLHRWQEQVQAEGMDLNPGYDPGYQRDKFRQ